MAADILIVKKHGNKISLKITQKMRAGYAPAGKIVVNLKNHKDVALFLHDLKDLYSVPIDKAIEEYKSKRSKVWPF